MNKDKLLSELIKKSRINPEIIHDFEYKFYLKELNFKLHYLLKNDNKYLGVHIISQFTSGTGFQKVPWWLSKFDQFIYPTLLIYCEDSSLPKRMSSEVKRKLVSHKYGIFLDYDKEGEKIRFGEDFALSKIEFYLK